MITLPTPHTPELLNRAEAFAAFRAGCKSFLQRHNQCFDKFTVVSHDSFIGYVSEQLICSQLHELYPDADIQTWEEGFDLEWIRRIISSEMPKEDEINYVRTYFYDRWDLAITSAVGNTIYADVKTALTRKEPRPDWTFLYPVVQAQKPGKEIAILAYYIVEDVHDPATFRRLFTVGYITSATILGCRVVGAGSRTEHNTLSNVDNYLTLLADHYRPLTELFGQPGTFLV